MNIWDYMDKHWFTAFCVLTTLASMPLYAWKYLTRHLNIRKRGWPPPHCDADGDFKQEEE